MGFAALYPSYGAILSKRKAGGATRNLPTGRAIMAGCASLRLPYTLKRRPVRFWITLTIPVAGLNPRLSGLDFSGSVPWLQGLARRSLWVPAQAGTHFSAARASEHGVPASAGTPKKMLKLRG